MKFQKKILWLDGSGGLIVGLLVLVFNNWLSELYQLPVKVVLLTAVANLVYGSYSSILASRSVRPLALIKLLAFANLSWTVVCLFIVTAYSQSISVFGIAHIMGEGIYVAVLAYFEWKWRIALQSG